MEPSNVVELLSDLMGKDTGERFTRKGDRDIYKTGLNKYEPEEGYSIYQYTKRLEPILEGKDDSEKIKILRDRLRYADEQKVSLMCRPDITSIDDYVSIVARTIDKLTEPKVRTQLNKCTQRKGEHIIDFWHRFSEIGIPLRELRKVTFLKKKK